MSKQLKRYTDGERMNHWFIAIMFVVSSLSGLALFHPSMYFFTNLFGGGVWTRILHPFMGSLMVLAFLLMFFRFVGDNLFAKHDKQWRAQMGNMIRGDNSKLPEVGKYNYGQKMVFWLMTISLLALVITGVMFWRPWFTPYFTIPIMRIASLIHAISAVVLILSVIVHVYAAIWVKGSTRAMTRGTVDESWARTHHSLWYKKITGKQ